MAVKKKKEEVFALRGEDLVKKVKELVKEGNAREIIIKDKKGKTLIMMPLTIGVVGAAVVFPIAVVGVVAALVTECTLVVRRK